MIKALAKHAKTVSTVFNQTRATSYLYNGLQWGQHHPAIFSELNTNLEARVNDVKDKKVKFINEAQLPYSFKGTKAFKPIKRALDTTVLDEKRVDLAKVQSKLHNYCSQYLKALSTLNVNDLPPCESNFHLAAERSFQLAKNSGFSIEMRHSIHELKEKGLRDNAEIFEVMHVVGLLSERALNLPLEYYFLDSSSEGKGLLTYNPKKELLDKKASEAKDAKVDNNQHPILKGHLQLVPNLQVILRAYVLYTTSYRMVPIQDGKEILGLDDYSFRHVAIFENQLRMPPVGALSYKETEDTLKEYRLQEWKLVDFDGFMHGNPLLVEEKYHDKLHYIHNN